MTFQSSDSKKTGDLCVRYCRECWNGNSKDGLFTNGDGYHYYEMLNDGTIQKAFEYYETDDAEERVLPLTEFIGVNWYEIFGGNDAEILENIPEHEFNKIMGIAHKNT